MREVLAQIKESFALVPQFCSARHWGRGEADAGSRVIKSHANARPDSQPPAQGCAWGYGRLQLFCTSSSTCFSDTAQDLTRH